MAWIDKVETWEAQIIHKHRQLAVPRDLWDAKRLARDLYFLDLSEHLKTVGRLGESECRAAGCEMICRQYWGNTCRERGGTRVPTIRGLMKLPCGNDTGAVNTLFALEAAAYRERRERSRREWET